MSDLLYCCMRCNQYKGDYWPTDARKPRLWNPRIESASRHFVHVEDGSLYALTTIGRFTLQRLRLNRAPLVAYRHRQQVQVDERRLLASYHELAELLDRLQAQQGKLLQEQQQLLEEQRALLRALLDEGM